MRYEVYFDAFASSVSHIFSDVSLLRRRLLSEGIVAFAGGMKEASDAVLTGLADHGSLCLDHLPFVPRGVFRSDLTIDQAPRVLDFLLMFNKLQVDGRELDSAIPGFLRRNLETKAFEGATWEDRLPIDDETRRWIIAFMGDVPTVLVGCKHGPGATAEKLQSWDKWLAVLDATRRHRVLRLTEVPKDFRKKRLIGIEPAWSQFLQQGVAHSLRSRAERACRYAHPHGPLRYLRAPQQHVAAACAEDYLTVDLEDASDRIPLSLVEYLFGSEWYKLLALLSTGIAEVRQGKMKNYHSLHMMATMGNGFCFELESLIFHLVAAIAAYNSQSIKWCSFNGCVGRISTFGDDLVLPGHWLSAVEVAFLKVGFRVNPKKTCRTPIFKETCGFWIVRGVGRPRLTPGLCGDKTELRFETQVERLDLAARVLDLGYVQLAQLLMEACASAPVRWNKKLHRMEISLSCQISVTRHANVCDENRHMAYWKTGLSDADLEHCHLRKGRRWMPLASYPFITDAGSALHHWTGRLFGRISEKDGFAMISKGFSVISKS